MQISIVSVGRMKRGPDTDLLDRYCERFNQTGRTLGLAPLSLVEIAESRAGSIRQRRSEEAVTVAARIADAPYFLCDEQGRSPTSAEVANAIDERRNEASKKLFVVLGGPDGLDHERLQRETGRRPLDVWAFGKITLPHGLARIILAEQLYRATTILLGHPYHRA